MWAAALIVATGLGQVKVASMGFEGIGVEPRLVTVLEQQVSARLAERFHVDVITASDVAAIIGIERQKELLGCPDSASSCTSELAGALGARALLRGDVTRLGPKLSATLKLLDAATARVLFAREASGDSEEQLSAALAERVEEMAPVFERLGSSGGHARIDWRPALPLVGAGAFAAIGIGFVVSAGQAVTDLRALANQPAGDAATAGLALYQRGKRDEVVAAVMFSCAAAALIAAIVWWLVGGGGR